MLVLGVDPGSIVTGYGLIEKEDNNLVYVCGGEIVSPSSLPFYARIHKIFKDLLKVIKSYRPEEMSIEDLFFAKNVKSALKIGHARGAALVAAIEGGLKVFEYTPLQIKQSLVGYGRATKEQVRYMVEMVLSIDSAKLSLDTCDALAAAICHHNWVRFETDTNE